ncbi:hypothetical protein V6N13_004606 [Hibiscus sabdariffa]|uniref:ATP synthase subunit d, mitochondrial n=1 Tax=Hibiscus sabdariffa TaxID=183260 RepID=A0ABR2RZH2_9ROSI
MRGRGKKVVDVAFKASKDIDWEGMAKLLVSDATCKEFAAPCCTFDDVNSTMQTKFSLEPGPIDWEYYRKGIGSRLVDIYKKAYESIEIPKFFDKNMFVKPTVALKAFLVGGIVVFAKVAWAMKAVGGAKLGAAATAMTVAESTTMIGLKHDSKDGSKQPPK